MTAAARARVIERFNDPKGPRVIIISSVGITGLNLQIANIMIIKVCQAFISSVMFY